MGLEINFDKVNIAFKKTIDDAICANGGTYIQIYSCDAKDGSFIVHFVYRGFKFTIAPNSTGQKYNYSTGYRTSNGLQPKGYMSYMSYDSTIGRWCDVSSVSLESLFKKLNKELKKPENLIPT